MLQESSYVIAKKQRIPCALKPDGFRFRRNEMQGVYFIIPVYVAILVQLRRFIALCFFDHLAFI